MVSQPKPLFAQDAAFCHPSGPSRALSHEQPLPTSLWVLKCLDLPLAGYLGGSGSRALPGMQKTIHGAAVGWGRQVRGQLRGGNARDRGAAAGRSEQLLEAGTQTSPGGAALILMPTSLGHTLT